MKIDIFAHILPKKYLDFLNKKSSTGYYLKSVIETLPTLYDMERRFRIMDKFDGLMQVLSMSSPPVHEIAEPQEAIELSMRANDEMAEIVLKNPDRFAAAIASLPLNNIDGALKEIDRALNELKFRGIQIETPANDKPLDLPEFLPIFEKMSMYNLPIWVHPVRNADYADYRTENRSKFMIFSNFGWPYETSVFMARMVFNGIFEKFPKLKIITHHAGGMIPFLEERIIGSYDHAEMLRRANYKNGLTRAPIDYFKKFYADTAIYGSTAGLTCAHSFFGAEHMLFGTDMPYDSQLGERYTRQTIQSIEQMEINQFEKNLIFEENARKIMRLPI